MARYRKKSFKKRNIKRNGRRPKSFKKKVARIIEEKRTMYRVITPLYGVNVVPITIGPGAALTTPCLAALPGLTGLSIGTMTRLGQRVNLHSWKITLRVYMSNLQNVADTLSTVFVHLVEPNRGQVGTAGATMNANLVALLASPAEQQKWCCIKPIFDQDQTGFWCVKSKKMQAGTTVLTAGIAVAEGTALPEMWQVTFKRTYPNGKTMEFDRLSSAYTSPDNIAPNVLLINNTLDDCNILITNSMTYSM